MVVWWALGAWSTDHPEIDAVVWRDDDLGLVFNDFNDVDGVNAGGH